MRVTIHGANNSPHQHVEIQIGDLVFHVEDRHSELIVRRVPGETPGMTLLVQPVSGNVVAITGGR